MEDHWFEDDVLLDGVRLHFVRTGNGDKPPLVLQHGRTDNGLCWVTTARDMEAEWDVIMPDARARGRSARVQPGEEVDQTADLAGLMRALDLGPAVVAGHSMGAWMASELGARFPEMVRGIVLEDPPWRSPKQRDNAAAPARAGRTHRRSGSWRWRALPWTTSWRGNATCTLALRRATRLVCGEAAA